MGKKNIETCNDPIKSGLINTSINPKGLKPIDDLEQEIKTLLIEGKKMKGLSASTVSKVARDMTYPPGYWMDWEEWLGLIFQKFFRWFADTVEFGEETKKVFKHLKESDRVSLLEDYQIDIWLHGFVACIVWLLNNRIVRPETLAYLSPELSMTVATILSPYIRQALRNTERYLFFPENVLNSPKSFLPLEREHAVALAVQFGRGYYTDIPWQEWVKVD